MARFRPRYDTLNDLLATSVRQYGDRPLFGTKSSGVFRFRSYAEFGRDVDRARAALAAAGIRRGDRVAVISDNRPEWATLAYATYGLGAVFVALYEAQVEGDWEHVLADSGASLVFVPGQVVARRLRPMRPRLAALRDVVVLEGPSDLDTRAYAAFLEAGDGAPVPVAAVGPDDEATFIYTSGTTARPKGVRLSHRNVAWNVCAIHELFPASPDDRSLSFLPWAHVFGQTVELHGMISVGGSIGLAQSLDTLIDDLRDVQPTLLFGVPRVFSRIRETVLARVERGHVVEQRVFRGALANAERLRKLAVARRTSGVADLGRLVYDRLVFEKIRARFGGRLRYAISGGAALSPEVAQFVDDLGLTVFEGYGLSETSPIVTANRPGARKLGSVGQCIAGVRVEIDTHVTGDPKHGEIVVYGHNVMLGYHHRPEDDAAVFVGSGEGRGFRTGDLGYLDGDGFLYITGRIKEQYKLQNGKYVVPSPVEEAIRLSPFVANVMIYGDNREYNVAVVVPAKSAVERWAAASGLSADARSLTTSSRLRAVLADELERTTAGMRSYERVRDFVVADEDFTVENGMMTPSLKVKRSAVLARYGDALEALYLARPA